MLWKGKKKKEVDAVRCWKKPTCVLCPIRQHSIDWATSIRAYGRETIDSHARKRSRRWWVPPPRQKRSINRSYHLHTEYIVCRSLFSPRTWLIWTAARTHSAQAFTPEVHYSESSGLKSSTIKAPTWSCIVPISPQTNDFVRLRWFDAGSCTMYINNLCNNLGFETWI
jgi:hypothetical protein